MSEIIGEIFENNPDSKKDLLSYICQHYTIKTFTGMDLEDLHNSNNQYPSTTVIATDLYVRMKNCRNSIENKNEYVSLDKVIKKYKAWNF